MSARDDQPLSIGARVLDALGLALLLVGFSVIVTGGFREFTPPGPHLGHDVDAAGAARGVAAGVSPLALAAAVAPAARVGGARSAPAVRSNADCLADLPVYPPRRARGRFPGDRVAGLCPEHAAVACLRKRFSRPARAVGYGLVSRRRDRRLQLPAHEGNPPAEHRVLSALPAAAALHLAVLRAPVSLGRTRSLAERVSLGARSISIDWRASTWMRMRRRRRRRRPFSPPIRLRCSTAPLTRNRSSC